MKAVLDQFEVYFRTEVSIPIEEPEPTEAELKEKAEKETAKKRKGFFAKMVSAAKK